MLYEDGLDNYLSVAVAQVQALAAQTAEVELQSRQMQASVSLIRALGGGWTVRALPSEKADASIRAIRLPRLREEVRQREMVRGRQPRCLRRNAHGLR
jgi:hypothetical protein